MARSWMAWTSVGALLLAAQAGCSSSDQAKTSESAGGSGSMAGSATAAAGTGGASASGSNAGGQSSAGSSSGGTSGGGSGPAAGAGGEAMGGTGGGASAYCGSELAAARSYDKAKVSDKVIDYQLQGAPGEQHYDVLLLMFNASTKDASTPSDPGVKEFYTPEELGDAYFKDPNGVAAFLSEASYGKVSVAGRVIGWLDQPAGSQPTAQDFQTNRETYAEQATPYATFSDYDVVYIVGLTDGDDQLQLGWQLQNSLTTSQGRWDGGIDWMVNSFFFTEAGQAYPYSTILPSRSWAHELHHTLGIYGHDISLDCGTSTLADACAFNAYGNGFSLMGESAIGNHPSIGMKQALAWLKPNQLLKVSASTQVTLCPSPTLDDKAKGLEIPLKTPLTITSTTVNMPAVFDRIFVEYRTAIGFDRYLDRLTDPQWQRRFLTTPRDIRKDGVVITLGYADPDTQSSALLDLHPAPTDFTQDGIVVAGNVGKFLDSMLLVGETFELADQGIKISPTALEGGGIRVDVSY
jgi:hypothetical protein